MHTIKINDSILQAKNDENLLEVLINNNIPINYACKLGNCHSCLINASEGIISQDAQKGLKETIKTQGYLLACQCQIQSNMTLSQKHLEGLRSKSKVLAIQKLTKNLLIIKLSIPSGFIFEAGQSVILWKNRTQGRNYSIASLQNEDYLELHIKKYDGGILSTWLFDEIKINDTLDIQGPSGHCFYTPTQTPLLLIGNGTGLSPLIGIIKKALQENHSDKIHLIHYAREGSQIYYQNEINALCKRHTNLTYEILVKNEKSHSTLIEISKEIIKKNNKHTLYLAGSDNLINLLRKQLYIAGASLSSIHSDAFIPHQ